MWGDANRNINVARVSWVGAERARREARWYKRGISWYVQPILSSGIHAIGIAHGARVSWTHTAETGEVGGEEVFGQGFFFPTDSARNCLISVCGRKGGN